MSNKIRHATTFLGIALFLIFAVASSDDNKSSSSTTEKSESSKNEKRPNWTYSEDVDKMEGTKRYYASCVSTNEIEFEFPYNGGSYFTLTIRNMGKGNEIILQVSKGQFMTSIMSSETCKVKFDDEKPVNFSYNSSADGSHDIIFLENSQKLLNKLKTAKKLMVETQFFNAGSQVIEFDVDGLNWNK
jgi:hypothetical protein